jgi:phosphoribosylaminoimidazole (AIR) synthetase
MVVIVNESHADNVYQTLTQYGEQVMPIGKIVKRDDSSVVISGIKQQWPN